MATADDGLAVQDRRALDPAALTPDTPEVISRQATVNIGTIGHVAHGKSTVVKAISGVQTVRFKNELERNITIKLGYANAKIYKRVAERPAARQLLQPRLGDEDAFEDGDGARWALARHVSFVDCPGHDILMATMLNGAAVMDAALLLDRGQRAVPAAADVGAPRGGRDHAPREHPDPPEQGGPREGGPARAQHEQIRKFVAGTVAGRRAVIPISAVLKYNIDAVCEYVAHAIPTPVRDFTSTPRLIVIRSFDVNKPGEDVANLKGGVAGGSILQGVLRLEDEVEVRPGIVTKDAAGAVTATPIYSRVASLLAERNRLEYAVPGGLIGVGTHIDPTLTRADRLVGQVLGLKGRLPDVFIEVEISFYLLRRLLGVKTSEGAKQAKVQKLQKQEILMVNIGSTATGGKVLAVKADLAKILLTQPVCTTEGEKIALSRRVDKHRRLIGWARSAARARVEVAAAAQ